MSTDPSILMASYQPAISSVPASEEQANQLLGNHVKLNVGGSPFFTTIGTLTKYDSMIRSMFSGRYSIKTDPKGWVMIDRSGKHFEKILNFLRDGSVPLPETKIELEEFLVEAKFYQIRELIGKVEEKISQIEDPFGGKSLSDLFKRVATVKSQDDQTNAGQLARKLSKPAVFLTISPNTRFPITEESKQNISKNLQLFEKLSLDFAGKVLFFKKGGSRCEWEFSGKSGSCVNNVLCWANEGNIFYRGSDVYHVLCRTLCNSFHE
ncbi:BTB/POZ domain-containing adapter for CUL3-mediated RhoA degradation protein 3-like [Brevipalpus obovatus]|uniref:BTB/POZ domain-containing adapter for CUL3-mediated RhoA degradation protein 3-like n=1 Tax=Brevipalpus obovatus TaxID=246614 RepID=UPI003D9EC57C